MQSGTILNNKYRLDKEIGSGGMGRVFSATHLEIGRKVAIKTLHREYWDNEQVLARLRQEARIAGSLAHDNICEVTDLGTTTSGIFYIVMPLLSGCSLGQLLRERETLSLKRTLDICCQTLDALEAAHTAGIVHRDLKPDNIFVSKYGDRGDFVKLLDFGICKLMRPGSATGLTTSPGGFGTPLYMAPEQAEGQESVDHRIDIYAMGVILYEILTGKKPHEGKSYYEIINNIITMPFDAPRSLNPEISPGIEEVILKALARDPAERFKDAREMRLALGGISSTAIQHQEGPQKIPGSEVASGQIDKAHQRHSAVIDTELDAPSPHRAGRKWLEKRRFLYLAFGVTLSLIAAAFIAKSIWADNASGQVNEKKVHRGLATFTPSVGIIEKTAVNDDRDACTSNDWTRDCPRLTVTREPMESLNQMKQERDVASPSPGVSGAKGRRSKKQQEVKNRRNSSADDGRIKKGTPNSTPVIYRDRSNNQFVLHYGD